MGHIHGSGPADMVGAANCAVEGKIDPILATPLLLAETLDFDCTELSEDHLH